MTIPSLMKSCRRRIKLCSDTDNSSRDLHSELNAVNRKIGEMRLIMEDWQSYQDNEVLLEKISSVSSTSFLFL